MRYKQLVRIAVNRYFSAVKLISKGHTIKDGSRLSEQWDRQMSGSVLDGEFDDKELRRALDGERDLELRGCAVFWASFT